MKFPENVVNVKKVTDLIAASLLRSAVQRQQPNVEVISQYTPFERDPWKLVSPEFIGFELPDGYIVPKMPVGTEYYLPNPDRIAMAREAYSEMKMSLKALKITMHEHDSESNHQVFWENLYTWSSSVVWVDKVTAEDIAGHVLFDSTMPLYSKRVTGTAIADVGKLLRGSVFYDKNVLAGKFPSYAKLPTNRFIVDGLEVSVFRPGNGYANGTTAANINRLATAESVNRSITGYLAYQLSETERATYLQQSWFARITALSQSSVFGNLYWSYCLRGLVK